MIVKIWFPDSGMFEFIDNVKSLNYFVDDVPNEGKKLHLNYYWKDGGVDAIHYWNKEEIWLLNDNGKTVDRIFVNDWLKNV